MAQLEGTNKAGSGEPNEFRQYLSDNGVSEKAIQSLIDNDLKSLYVQIILLMYNECLFSSRVTGRF